MKRLLVLTSLLVSAVGCSKAEAETETGVAPESQLESIDGSSTTHQALDMQVALNKLSDNATKAAAESTDAAETQNLQDIAQSARDLATKINSDVVEAQTNGADKEAVATRLEELKAEYDALINQFEGNTQTMSDVAKAFMTNEIATARDARNPGRPGSGGGRPGGGHGGNTGGGNTGGGRPGGDRPGGGWGNPGGGHGGNTGGGNTGGGRPGGDRPGGGWGNPGGGHGGNTGGGNTGGGWGNPGGGHGGGWGNPGGPRPRPIPIPIPIPVPSPGGYDRWIGECRVVLEDRYGSVLRSFQGYGQSRDRYKAIEDARDDAMDQCRDYERAGAYQCVQDRCETYRDGR